MQINQLLTSQPTNPRPWITPPHVCPSLNSLPTRPHSPEPPRKSSHAFHPPIHRRTHPPTAHQSNLPPPNTPSKAKVSPTKFSPPQILQLPPRIPPRSPLSIPP
ncbi:hypothetical protein BDY21DRAFT_334509, partial [Lineolata rhizophorae]